MSDKSGEHAEQDGRKGWPFLLADGDPRIAQITMTGPFAYMPKMDDAAAAVPADTADAAGEVALTDDTPAAVAGDPAEEKSPNEPPAWTYWGVRSLALDARGRIIRFQTWPALCGPPPPPPPKGQTSDGGTLAPLPGVTMDERHTNCWVQDAATVRESAKASEVWGRGGIKFEWVRDGDH
jgi:hypothetical protein